MSAFVPVVCGGGWNALEIAVLSTAPVCLAAFSQDPREQNAASRKLMCHSEVTKWWGIAKSQHRLGLDTVPHGILESLLPLGFLLAGWWNKWPVLSGFTACLKDLMLKTLMLCWTLWSVMEAVYTIYSLKWSDITWNGVMSDPKKKEAETTLMVVRLC